MRISDHVAKYILDLLNRADGVAEIQRNELAALLGCVPSQINYVITSRFTPENGYVVESRRGGGGYIRITRRQLDKSDLIMHIIHSIGEDLDIGTANAMLDNLLANEVISPNEARMIKAAITSQCLGVLPKELRDGMRSSLFKSMLLVTE